MWRGAPFTVRGRRKLFPHAFKKSQICVCVNGCSEVVIGEPLADKQGLSLSVYTCQRVCEAEAAALRWFTCAIPARVLACLNTCTVGFEWWPLLRWSPRGLPTVAPPPPAPPILGALCHQRVNRRSKCGEGEDEKGTEQLSEEGVCPARGLTHEWKI